MILGLLYKAKEARSPSGAWPRRQFGPTPMERIDAALGELACDRQEGECEDVRIRHMTGRSLRPRVNTYA